MKLFNTLSKQKEEFKPISGKHVGFYACGPTVYDVAHIGNFRTYLFEDILKRTLIQSGYDVKHVMNLTDVDDKTIRKSDGKKEEFKKIIQKYEDQFFSDLKKLNILPPDVTTRATEYIEKIVSFIEELQKKGFAYKASDGSIYFSIAKFSDYGKLSKLDKEGIQSGARVSQDEYDKDNPADFALWKAWDENDGEIFWETTLGKGRPGWHIECSAMSGDVLGDTIDIHAGAVDLIFPHHENEIAQTESKTGKKFVNFWIHGEHLLVDGRKMSKSLGNLYTMEELSEKGFSPLDFRYLVLGAHYRTKLNFSWQGMESAKNTRERLVRLIDEAREEKGGISEKYLSDFNSKIADDLDMPGALAVLWEMLRDPKLAKKDKYATSLEMDKVFGLGLSTQIKENIPEEIVGLAEKRKTAKLAKDFNLADQLRVEIEQKGFEIEDVAGGEYKIIKKG